MQGRAIHCWRCFQRCAAATGNECDLTPGRGISPREILELRQIIDRSRCRNFRYVDLNAGAKAGYFERVDANCAKVRRVALTVASLATDIGHGRKRFDFNPRPIVALNGCRSCPAAKAMSSAAVENFVGFIVITCFHTGRRSRSGSGTAPGDWSAAPRRLAWRAGG